MIDRRPTSLRSVASSGAAVRPAAIGLALCGAALAAVGAVTFAAHGGALWRLVATAAVLAGAAAVLRAGLGLLARGRLPLLGGLLVVAAPAAAGLLLAGAWRDEASRLFVQALLTATTVAIGGLAVASLRLLLRDEHGLAEATYRAVAALAAGVAALALVVVWWSDAPGVLLDALLGSVGGTAVLYAAAAGIAGLERRA